jgi:hypothetical protein
LPGIPTSRCSISTIAIFEVGYFAITAIPLISPLLGALRGTIGFNL